MRLNRVLETCLYSKDLGRTKNFYANILDLVLYGEQENRHVFFKMPDGAVLLFFNPDETSKEGQGLPSHFATGHQHLAFEIPKNDYQAWKERIERANIPIIQEQTWKNGVRSFYFRDPDGHLLEICEPGIWE